MADFDARFTAGASLEVWSDPPLGAQPSRINPLPAIPHRRRVATLGNEVEISAIVAAVEGPVDGALGGRLFYGWLAEYAGARPNVSSPSGQSSVRRFTPTAPGHFTYVLRRQRGGGIILHLDVVNT